MTPGKPCRHVSLSLSLSLPLSLSLSRSLVPSLSLSFSRSLSLSRFLALSLSAALSAALSRALYRKWWMVWADASERLRAHGGTVSAVSPTFALSTRGPSWGYFKVIFYQVYQLFTTIHNKMAPSTGKRLQYRGRDTPTKGLLWSNKWPCDASARSTPFD